MARHPLFFITITIIVAAAFTGLSVVIFDEDKDPEYLYAPNNAQSVKDREYVRDIFGYPVVLVGHTLGTPFRWCTK